MEDCTYQNVNRLLRGIATDHVATVRDAWRALLADGPSAVPAVRAKLASNAWSEAPRGPLPRYLGLLLALLAELDPEAFRDDIRRLESARLHPLHRRTLDLMARRLDDTPVARIGPGLPVYVAPEIGAQDRIKALLTRWSRTRGLDLARVTRIDVIPRTPDLDYLGLYNIFFSGIILTWPAEPPRGLRRLWVEFRAEFTFYHEVGHHVHGHIEGGVVAEQEAEADAYARVMMRRSRPVLTTLARACLLPFRPLFRWAVARDATRVDSLR